MKATLHNLMTQQYNVLIFERNGIARLTHYTEIFGRGRIRKSQHGEGKSVNIQPLRNELTQVCPWVWQAEFWECLFIIELTYCLWTVALWDHVLVTVNLWLGEKKSDLAHRRVCSEGVFATCIWIILLRNSVMPRAYIQ